MGWIPALMVVRFGGRVFVKKDPAILVRKIQKTAVCLGRQQLNHEFCDHPKLQHELGT